MQTADVADADLLYGVAAFAQFLGVTKRQAQYLVESGRVPHFNIEGSRTICGRRSTLTAWLAEQEAKAAHCPKRDGDSPRRSGSCLILKTGR